MIAQAQRLVGITDLAFTAPGALLILVTGWLMAPVSGGMGVPWLTWGIALFTVTGVIWLALLVPIQVMQTRLARGFAASGRIPPRYWTLARAWAGFGLIATLLPLVNLYLMVFKPG
jgi:uncharacterized membrane protein